MCILKSQAQLTHLYCFGIILLKLNGSSFFTSAPRSFRFVSFCFSSAQLNFLLFFALYIFPKEYDMFIIMVIEVNLSFLMEMLRCVCAEVKLDLSGCYYNSFIYGFMNY